MNTLNPFSSSSSNMLPSLLILSVFPLSRVSFCACTFGRAGRKGSSSVSLHAGVDVPMMVADGCIVYHLYNSRKVKESNLESSSDVFFEWHMPKYKSEIIQNESTKTTSVLQNLTFSWIILSHTSQVSLTLSTVDVTFPSGRDSSSRSSKGGLGHPHRTFWG